MPLIKNGAEIANEWTFVPDGAVLREGGPEKGKVSVSLARFLGLKQGQENGPLPDGVRLGPADTAEDLEPYLSELSLIEVDFPATPTGVATARPSYCAGATSIPASFARSATC